MTANPHNPNPSASTEETLRIVANLPAPAGLEDRLHTVLRDKSRRHALDAGVARKGQLLAWPAVARPQSGWMRTAAAAAIVFVVAGGGWGVYTRVQQNHPGKVIVMPTRSIEPGGLSGAGAIRKPQTLPGPLVKQLDKKKAVHTKPAVQPAARNTDSMKNAEAK